MYFQRILVCYSVLNWNMVSAKIVIIKIKLFDSIDWVPNYSDNFIGDMFDL